MKRLSALAQLVALYAEKGITSTNQLMQATGFSERAIWGAKAALRCTLQEDAPLQEDAGCTLQEVAPSPCTPVQGAKSLLPPLKKKGLPHTPSKEKIHPTPHPEEASAIAEAAADDSKLVGGRPIPREILIPLEACFPKLAENYSFLGLQIKTHGERVVREAADRLLAKVIDGADVHKPTSMLVRIIGDVVHDWQGRSDPTRSHWGGDAPTRWMA